MEVRSPSSVSASHDPSKVIGQVVEEIARLSEQARTPADFYAEFLQRVHVALAADGGAIWIFTPEKALDLQSHINFAQFAWQQHDEILHQAISKTEPSFVAPKSSEGEKTVNPTNFVILLAPILVEKEVQGVVEVWIDGNRLSAVRGLLKLLALLTGKASAFAYRCRFRHFAEKARFADQLDGFFRRITSSLDPTEVAILVANEGKRLIECDRLSVAQRRGQKTNILAVSGSEVVEQRSTLIQNMRALIDLVLKWNEQRPLVYSGKRDDTLPPNIQKALDEYLVESTSRLLVLLPLRDTREKDQQKPCRSALLLECYEPKIPTEQFVARLEVIGRQATGPLYNAAELHRLPLRRLLLPIAQVREGLSGRTKAIVGIVAAVVLLLTAILVFVPYPLKMEAKGQLLPNNRVWLFPPAEGHVVRFDIKPGMLVEAEQKLVLMHDMNLEIKIVNLNKEIDAAEKDIQACNARMEAARTNVAEQLTIGIDKRKQESVLALKLQERDRLREKTNAESRRPGNFWVKSPIQGMILNSDFQEKFTGKHVRASEPLLRVGDARGEWVVELKIPQKHIGQVLRAYERNGTKELDVDLLLTSDPTHTFKGKLARDQIGGEANPNRDEHDEAEPVVKVVVRIEGDDLDQRVPRNLFLSGTEVHAKIRCGNRAMGYSLFYGVWEFLFEKVIFAF